MGNCQAIDAASLVIQHPNGKEERLYWPVMAKDVMKSNPGHYVALLITFRVAEEMESDTNHHHQQHDSTTTTTSNGNGNGGVRITRVKLLRPTDTLVFGQAYRLIDTQEVMKGLWAKKFAKMNKKKKQLESSTETTTTTTLQKVNENLQTETKTKNQPESEMMMNQAPKLERHRQRTSSSGGGGGGGALARSRAWRPSLQSISEGQGVS